MGPRRSDHQTVGQRADGIDQRTQTLIAAAETFVARFGAELARAQAELSPSRFASFVETLGIGRQKAERMMAVARLQQAQVDEVRPSAWHVLFRAADPIPLLPGEADPIITFATATAEPTPLRRRVDLLGPDGLVHLLVAFHDPEAMSAATIELLGDWLAGRPSRSEAVQRLRSWRTTFGEGGNPESEPATCGRMSKPEEARP